MSAVSENKTKRRRRREGFVSPSCRPLRRGEWTAETYLARDFEGLVEFVDGKPAFLPMATPFHRDLQLFLYHQLLAATRTRSHAAKIYWAPLRISIDNNRYRDPGMVLAGRVLVRPEHVPNRHRPVVGADRVMEIDNGSKGDRDQDLIVKRQNDAQARIPEYGIVDPETETIAFFTLPTRGAKYKLHGEFKPGRTATSKLLDGFAVNVAACFAAGKGEAA
jgi:Uma2 family endonuclease